ncbi:uncharacterized protein LOC126673899 [Mercurialis annua]|uniref:uncharacterized protein LOC126673899 n=1 Tax=Mercurialis annua TaxID=3986 RepID=UPI00215F5FC4|nr:uncharacterized protein LOC126673899 [Mercurialis annua]
MDAIFFHPNSIITLQSCFHFSKQINQRTFYCSLREIADRPSAFTLPNIVLQVSISNDCGRRGRSLRKSYLLVRTKTEDTTEKYPLSDGKPPRPRQEEVLALFRRINSSISNKEAKSKPETNIRLSKEMLPANKSIGENLQQSKKQDRDVRNMKYDQQNDVLRLAAKFNVNRPPSKFVRSSLVPSQSIPKVQLNSVQSRATDNEKASKLLHLEEMRLLELKEVAKSRGIKGYSKLKKGQLLELLKSQETELEQN